MSNGAWVDGKYQAGRHEVLRRMLEWSMPPSMYEMAKDWCERLRMDTHHEEGVYFPGTLQNEDGLFFATSHGTTAKAEYRIAMYAPDYLDYKVWFSSGLHFDNIRHLHRDQEKYPNSPLTKCTSKNTQIEHKQLSVDKL
jgi:hypothetical protein